VSKKILVVDDEKDVLFYLSAILEDKGFTVSTATDGIEAVNEIKSIKPDLVLLDITMPNQSGVKVYRQIKKDDALKAIPVIIITGILREFKQFISTRKQVPPPEGYLEKPVSPTDVLFEVQRLIGLN
jgi:CheY-like chemotaxis protein